MAMTQMAVRLYFQLEGANESNQIADSRNIAVSSWPFVSDGPFLEEEFMLTWNCSESFHS